MGDFLKYANETQSNIIPKESFEELVREVFSTISDNLSKSLGPLGSTTTIIDGVYTSATKDGFTILKNLRFRNKYKTMIYNLIKAPCVKMNNTVGDGTTTAIVLTNHMFNKYMEHRNQLSNLYRLPRTFTKIWDTAMGEVIELIKSYGNMINLEGNDILDVAYIASNGNDEISNNIASVYRQSKSPVIKLKNSPTNKSYIEAIKGFEFPANLIDEAYCKNEDLSAEENNVKILLFNYKIDTDTFNNLIKVINEIYRPSGEKILVLAPAYDELMMKTVLKNYINTEFRTNNSTLNLILAQYLYGSLAPSQMEDLSVILGCELITLDLYKSIMEKLSSVSDGEQYEVITNDEFNIIGEVKKASLSIHNGSVFTVNDLTENQKYQQQLKGAEAALEAVMNKIDNDKKAYAIDIAKANARIAQLKMENYIYYIGADSTLQANILYDTVDDVIKAVASANKYGVVPGCQLSIIRACNELITAATEVETNDDVLRLEILQIIKSSVISLYASILHGPYNNGIYKLIPNVQNMTDSQQIINLVNNKCLEIIGKSIEHNVVFDMEFLTFSNKVITSVETDINVLTSSSELVKLLISGNQCVFIDYSLDGAQDTQVEM